MSVPLAVSGTRAALKTRLEAVLREMSAWSGPSARVRFAFYVMVLTVLGSFVCFYKLSEGMLLCDEASFAYTTDRMLRTGNWVVPYIHDRGPHLNAAPLYSWLTNLAVPLWGESNTGYRIWSAGFGVACVLAALVLGTILFRAEVGFIAGLLLLGNFHFVFMHGMRACVMEPALAFFVTTMVICYVRTYQAPERAGLWWGLTGLSLGLAVLTKPPAMGGFFFCTLCLHHVLVRRDLAWKVRLLGPLAAGLVAALVALPWYAMIYARLGWPAIDHLFLTNSVRRAADPGAAAPLPITFYIEQLWDSSRGFKLALPALAWGIGCAISGWQRRAWSLLVVLLVPFLLALSTSATKHEHYVFTAFPFLAIAAGALLSAGLSPPHALESSRGRWIWRSLAFVGIIGAVIVIRYDLSIVKWFLKANRAEYPALRLYHATEADLIAGDGRLVLFNFPVTIERLDRNLGFTAHDLYYLARMPAVVHVSSMEELNRLLADGKPTVLMLPPQKTTEEKVKAGLRIAPDHSLLTRSELFAYPVMTFNQAEAKLGLTKLLREMEISRDTGVMQP